MFIIASIFFLVNFICGISILLCTSMYLNITHVTSILWVFCFAYWPSKSFVELVKSPYWLDGRYWQSLSVRRTFCHSTKCLILYHFVLCTFCLTNHLRRLYIYISPYYFATCIQYNSDILFISRLLACKYRITRNLSSACQTLRR